MFIIDLNVWSFVNIKKYIARVTVAIIIVIIITIIIIIIECQVFKKVQYYNT